MLSRSPLWLVAPVSSLSPPSLCFYGSAHPSQSHSPPQLEVAALGCRPHSRIPWLEALMLLLLLLLQLFQALWCHLKEGPALMPRVWVTTREGEREREREIQWGGASKHQGYAVCSHLVTWDIKTFLVEKPAHTYWCNWADAAFVDQSGLLLNKTVSKRSVVTFFCLLLLLYFKMNCFFEF